MSPNLDRAMEKRSPEYFDNQGFEPTEKESLGIPRTHSYPFVQVAAVHVQPKFKVRKRTQIFAALAGNPRITLRIYYNTCEQTCQ